MLLMSIIARFVVINNHLYCLNKMNELNVQTSVKMNVKTYEDLPGFSGCFVVGILPYITEYPEQVYMRWSERYGPVYKVKIGSWDCVVINGYDNITEALLTRKGDFCDRPNSPIISLLHKSSGLFFSSSTDKRKELHSTFVSLLHRSYQDIHIHMERSIYKLCKILDRSTMHVNVQDLLSVSSADIITKMLFPSHRFEGSQLRDLINEIYQPFTSQKFSLLFLMPWLQYLPNFQSYLKETSSSARGTVMKVCRWLSNEIAYKDKESIAQACIDMMFAGIRTVSCQTTWVLYFLLMNPVKLKILKKTLENEEFTYFSFYEKSERLSYLRACIYETFRLRPISPSAFMRSTVRRTQVGGFQIPKGTMVVTNLWSSHHDLKYWGENVEDYFPERHLNARNEFMKSNRIINFSLGERKCLGAEMAEKEIMLYIFNIVKRYDISMDNASYGLDPRGQSGSILKPPNIKVKFRPSS